jgi:ABC-2 type transport system ATP-binding protein
MLKAENIHKQYAAHKALDGVSISLSPGKIFGLLGPNGAGKTTLIRILNQIIGPDSGSLYFGDEPLNEKHIAKIGYLPEERGLYKKMKVGEQAMYLASLKGMENKEMRKQLKYWFERFQLEDWWHKKVEELSKGMQQKVQFITTLIHNPDVIILDEPFSGFDPVNAEKVKAEILQLRSSGKTILLSTHRMESVEALCDEIALIHKSKVHLQGTVNEIRQRYSRNRYKLSFEGAELSPPEISGFDLEERNQKGTVQEWIFRLEGEQRPDELLGNVMRSHRLLHFEEMLPDMNQIFIENVSDTQ